MGLDMYLRKEIYIGAKFEHNKISGDIKLFQNGVEIPINLNRVSSISEEICYWRKANQIHHYFVKNHSRNGDDCQPIYIDIDDLQKLVNVCKQVQNNKHLAESLLPVQTGFFFGSYEYDDDYFQQIDYTINELEKIIKEHTEQNNRWSDYYYQASW